MNGNILETRRIVRGRSRKNRRFPDPHSPLVMNKKKMYETFQK